MSHMECQLMCMLVLHYVSCIFYEPVRETVSYRGLFTAGWFDVREKHYSRLEIYDRLRASEQAACSLKLKFDLCSRKNNP